MKGIFKVIILFLVICFGCANDVVTGDFKESSELDLTDSVFNVIINKKSNNINKTKKESNTKRVYKNIYNSTLLTNQITEGSKIKNSNIEVNKPQSSQKYNALQIDSDSGLVSVNDSENNVDASNEEVFKKGGASNVLERENRNLKSQMISKEQIKDYIEPKSDNSEKIEVNTFNQTNGVRIKQSSGQSTIKEKLLNKAVINKNENAIFQTRKSITNDSVKKVKTNNNTSLKSESVNKVTQKLNEFETNSTGKLNNSIKSVNTLETGSGIGVENTGNQKPTKISAENSEFLNNGSFNIIVKPLYETNAYKTDQNHTLVIELTNAGKKIDKMSFEALLPIGWKLISLTSNATLKVKQKKIIFLSVFIPGNAPAGNTRAVLYIKTMENNVLKTANLDFNLANNLELDVFNVNAPQQVNAGELIKISFAIKNNGNVNQQINLKSKNTILGKEVLTIAPDSTIIVDLTQETDSRMYFFRTISTGLEVYSNESGESYRAFGSVNVFPTKLKQKDPFFRYPIKASLLYNSYNNKSDHFSTMSAELRGDGYLDVDKKHHLNFIIRGPKQDDLKRFGVTDQYSLIYRNNNKTTLYLGDHAYQINKLGFNDRYGMGFRINQNINKWRLSAFYTKPRLYKFNSAPMLGVKAVYNINDSLSTGLSVVRSKGLNNSFNQGNNDNSNEKGQILTYNLDYMRKNTSINAEYSTSITNNNVDLAAYLSVMQRFKNLTYSGSFTMAGENYFGTISNSLQYSNNLNYDLNNWNFGIGQSLFKLNKKLDPLFYAAEPYFESYYAYIGRRFNKNHKINFRLDKRLREDKLEPKSYHYKEYGVNYNYAYNSSTFYATFNGRIAKTQNLLSKEFNYRNTYSHSLNLSYRFLNNIRLRGNINHNYSNRYGTSNSNLNYYRYSLGFNYNFNKDVRVNATYNSGFSPEDNYLKRDYINVGFLGRVNRNHQLEIRSNYFETPGTTNSKELLVFAKYTYSFGAPIKKILKQGGVTGHIYTSDKTINVKGIKIIAAGKTVLSDKNGKFELNNLTLGKNFILLEESTLPNEMVTSSRLPYEVIISEGKKTELEIQLVKSSSVYGTIKLNNSDEAYSLKGYLKIENEEFTYFTESNRKGEFKFKSIIPGIYELTLIRLIDNDKLFKIENNVQVNLKEGQVNNTLINVKLNTREIKFNNKNFKVGE